jgi:hypothetical protein
MRTGALVAGLALVATASVVTSRHLDTADSQADTAIPAEAATEPPGPEDLALSPYGDDASLDQIRELLDQRSEAILDGDRRSFLATLDDADPDFVRQQTDSFDNLRRLGVAEMGYGVDDRMLPVTPVRGDDPEIKPTVVEHVQLEDVDARVVSHEVGFTFVERDGTWLLGAERIDETQRTLSSIGVSRPWAEGPVAVRRQGPLTVVVDEERSEVLPTLTARAAQALGYVRGQLDVQDREPLLVDATSTGAATRLSYHGTAVAGATFGPAMTMRLNGSEPIGIGGWRIKFNPDRLDLFLDDDRMLRHELTHFVLRDKAHPLWLMEGLAEHLGWKRAPMTRLYVPRRTFDRLATQMPRDRLLPAGEFNRNPLVGYIGSQAVVEELAAQRGIAGVMELVDTYARLAGRGMGPAEVDRAALERTFSTTPAELAAAGYRRLMGIQRP